MHARLNWFASGPQDEPKDTQVTLQAPGGEVWTVDKDDMLSEEFDDPLVPCIFQPPEVCQLSFFSYYADVTELLQGHLDGGASLNGQWTVGDMQHLGADPNNPRLQAVTLASVGIGAGH